jgi:hypothetical protein
MPSSARGGYVRPNKGRASSLGVEVALTTPYSKNRYTGPRNGTHTKSSDGEPDGKRLTGKPRRRRGDNIKVDSLNLPMSTKLVYIFIPYIFHIHFNIIFQSTPSLQRGISLQVSRLKFYMHFSSLMRYYIPRLFHSF